MRILISFTLIYLINSSDPDLELCQDLFIDAAVSADDNNDYVFKGDYYWKIDTDRGISQQYGEPIKDRWNALPTPINASFTIDEQRHRFTTVFIRDNNWYLYKQNNQLETGTTNNWPYFTRSQIQGSFTYYNSSLQRREFPIYFIYNDEYFSKYIIQDIAKPNYIISSKAYRKGRFLYFLYDPNAQLTQTIGSYIKVKAVIANSKHLIIFGDKDYCKANISEVAPKCEIYDVTNFFNCPRTPRPTTEMTSTTTMTTISTITTSTTSATTETTANTGSVSITDTESVSITEMGSTNSETTGDMKTDTEFDTTTDSNPMSTFLTDTSDTTVTTDFSLENEEKVSKMKYFIPVIVIIVVIFVLCIGFVIFTVYKNKRKTSDKKPNIKKSEENINSDGKEQTIVVSKSGYKKTGSNESLETGTIRSKSGDTYGLNDKQEIPDSNDAQKLGSEEPKKSTISEESLNVTTDRGVKQSESNESLATAMKRAKSSLTDSSIVADENQSTLSMTEADQLIDKIKSKENFDN